MVFCRVAELALLRLVTNRAITGDAELVTLDAGFLARYPSVDVTLLRL